LTKAQGNAILKLCRLPINPKRKKDRRNTAFAKEWRHFLAAGFCPKEGERAEKN